MVEVGPAREALAKALVVARVPQAEERDACERRGGQVVKVLALASTEVFEHEAKRRQEGRQVGPGLTINAQQVVEVGRRRPAPFRVMEQNGHDRRQLAGVAMLSMEGAPDVHLIFEQAQGHEGLHLALMLEEQVDTDLGALTQVGRIEKVGDAGGELTVHEAAREQFECAPVDVTRHGGGEKQRQRRSRVLDLRERDAKQGVVRLGHDHSSVRAGTNCGELFVTGEGGEAPRARFTPDVPTSGKCRKLRPCRAPRVASDGGNVA